MFAKRLQLHMTSLSLGYLGTDSDVIMLSTGQNIHLCSASSVRILAG